MELKFNITEYTAPIDSVTDVNCATINWIEEYGGKWLWRVWDDAMEVVEESDFFDTFGEALEDVTAHFETVENGTLE